MDEGCIVEDCAPEQFFTDSSNERVKRFLSQMLHH
jgi:ABC-type polar amino acid transport system ATPase subunit